MSDPKHTPRPMTMSHYVCRYMIADGDTSYYVTVTPEQVTAQELTEGGFTKRALSLLETQRLVKRTEAAGVKILPC